MNNKENYRQFSVHPAIIKSIINEQADCVSKAFAELVMNAKDAGATKIDITVLETGEFKVIDDGRGFRDKDEILSFFETFGAPHEDGDATFGKFRIGRGQVMSHASVSWRSGYYEMKVDLQSLKDTFGYELVEHPSFQEGCVVSGKLYSNKYSENKYTRLMGLYYGSEQSLEKMIRYLDIPVILNGSQINKIPSQEKWDYEDEYAYYKFVKYSEYNGALEIYNQGIYVKDDDNRAFHGFIVSKKPLTLNMARNEIQHCDTWYSIIQSLRELFSIKITKTKKLTPNECIALLRDILNPEVTIDHDKAATIKNIKFIPDIQGELHSPNELLKIEAITVYDGVHSQVAEKVQKEKLAIVLTKDLLKKLDIPLHSTKIIWFIQDIAKRLDFYGFHGFHYVSFEEFVDQLDEASLFINEKELNEEEKIVLTALEDANYRIAKLLRLTKRKLKVGLSDSSRAWTDGVSYIAVERKTLLKIRGSSVEKGLGVHILVNTLIHEYCHDSSSSKGGHGHDYDFYKSYHDVTIHNVHIGKIIDATFRRYLKGLSKLQKRLSSDHSAHLKGLLPYMDTLLIKDKKD